MPDSAKGYLGYVLSHSNDPQILPLIEAAVEARTDLNPILRNNRCCLGWLRRIELSSTAFFCFLAPSA